MIFSTVSRVLAVATLASGVFSTAIADNHDEATPLKVLVVTGGCYHNYEYQTAQMTKEVGAKLDITWTVKLEDCGDSNARQISLYDDPDWAKPYDVVVHNECFADTTDPEYIRKITTAHKAGVPAVVVHCAMHTYRDAKIDDWREFLGVTSYYHEHQSRYPVHLMTGDHPVIKDFPTDWVTERDELYVIDKVWPGVNVLAVSISERTGKASPVIWVNDYHGTRVFGTTYGHSDATFRDPNFIDLLTRGIRWAAGREQE